MHVFIISEAQRHLFRALVQATCRQEMSPCTPDCQIFSTSLRCHCQSHGSRSDLPNGKDVSDADQLFQCDHYLSLFGAFLKWGYPKMDGL